MIKSVNMTYPFTPASSTDFRTVTTALSRTEYSAATFTLGKVVRGTEDKHL